MLSMTMGHTLINISNYLLPTRPTIQVRRNFLTVAPADNRIRTEATHHAVKPHPSHRRHHNQQRRQHQTQAQLLGYRIHHAGGTIPCQQFHCFV